MPSPQLFISTTLCSLRRTLLHDFCQDVTRLPLVLLSGFGAVRGWRRVAQEDAHISRVLPHFAVTDRWFEEASLASVDASLRFISPVQRRLVLRALLTTIKPQLNELKGLVNSNKFLVQLDRWISNLSSAGVPAWPPNGGPWSRDLQLIFQRYLAWQRRHGDGRLRDGEYAPSIFAQNADNYPQLPTCIIAEGLIAPSPNECAGIKALISHCDTFAAALVIPGIGRECANWPVLFQYTKDTVLEKTLSFWREQNATLHVVDFQAQPAMHLSDLPSVANAKTQIHVKSAHSAWHELRQTAQSIRERYSDIHEAVSCGVIVSNAGSSMDTLKSTFIAHGLPLQRMPSQPLSRLPLVQKLMQMINLPTHRWSVGALVDVFGGDSLQWKLENHVMDVRRIKKVANAIRQFSLENEAALSHLLDGFANVRDLDGELFQKDIDALMQLQERIQSIRDAVTVEEWTVLMGQLWRDATCCWNDEDENENESSHAEMARLQIQDALSVLTTFRRSSDWWQKYFRGKHKLWLGQLNVLLGEMSSGGQSGVRCGINISSPRQLMQDVPDVIYWTGMTEYDYPSVSRDSLQARHQNTMNQLCPHLQPSPAESTYWLALALAEAKEVHFSWPAFHNGRIARPTVLLEDVQRQLAKTSLGVEHTSIYRQQKYFCWAQWRGDVGWAARNMDKLPDDLNDPLAQSVFHLFRARHAVNLGEYDGSLGDSGAMLVKQILQKRGVRLAHSASSLKNYAECGLKYFFKHILALETSTNNSLLLEKNERGTLIHSILEKFYRSFPHVLEASYQDAAWELLKQIAREEVVQLPISESLQQLELYQLIAGGTDNLRGALGEYLRSEVELRNDWDESVFSLPLIPFGLSGMQLPHKLARAYEGNFTLKMDDIAVDGKFDRLDVGGANEAVIAVDYKTGKVPSSFAAPDGIDFQMPLYLWALNELFGEQNIGIGGTFYSLQEYRYVSGIARNDILKKQKGRQSAASPRPLSGEEWEDFIEVLSGQIRRIHQLIINGHFPISARGEESAGCQYCDFRNICFRDRKLQEERQKMLRNNEFIYLEGRL